MLRDHAVTVVVAGTEVRAVANHSTGEFSAFTDQKVFTESQGRRPILASGVNNPGGLGVLWLQGFGAGSAGRCGRSMAQLVGSYLPQGPTLQRQVRQKTASLD